MTSITTNSAVCGGNITSDGNGAISARGVCWDTAAAPTLANSYTNDGTGTGVFTSNITGLTADETYYIRAYATNLKGTQYGGQRSFLTLGAGIDEQIEGTIKVYQSGNFLMIDFGTQNKQDVQFSLFDMTGKNISTYSLKDQFGISAILLPGVATGIYSVKFIMDNKVITKQIYITQ